MVFSASGREQFLDEFQRRRHRWG